MICMLYLCCMVLQSDDVMHLQSQGGHVLQPKCTQNCVSEIRQLAVFLVVDS